MTVPSPIHLDPAAPAGEHGEVSPDKVLSGHPVPTATTNLYSDRTGRFHCGFWESGAGRWRVSYAEDELCTILSGEVRLESEDGGTWGYGPGDSFVIPAGFKGTWKSIGPVRKLYVIHEG